MENYKFSQVIFMTCAIFSQLNLICMLVIPFVSAYLNIYVNKLLLNETAPIFHCLVLKMIQDYVHMILQNRLFQKQVAFMNESMKRRMNRSVYRCGVILPGVNQKQHEDLKIDTSKLRDFLFVMPLLWTAIVSFTITIYTMETESEYPVRFLFGLFVVVMCGMITYFTDASVYEKVKPDATTVVELNNPQYVHAKISNGCKLDEEFHERKIVKIENQQNVQKYIIIVVNLLTTYISLQIKKLGQLYAFGNISWMVGCLADNIKSLQYYTYMGEFISFYTCLEFYKYKSMDEVPIGDVYQVKFVKASFGYLTGDLLNNPTYEQKITSLTYTFTRGIFYYLEADNGIGKSTILRMFKSNLFGGKVFFGSINRLNLSFEDVYSNVFHVVQASEYQPKFTKNEINISKNKDVWLEERLGLKTLFGKDMVEISGGQKKRMLLYLVLTSDASIILLDEILSELSTYETPEVPEGGGWLSRVIRTLIEWEGRKNKIMILVGHGLLGLIPRQDDIRKLNIVTEKGCTMLKSIKRH